MKRILTFLTAALLVTGVGFAASETIGKKKKKKCAKMSCCNKTAKAGCCASKTATL